MKTTLPDKQKAEIVSNYEKCGSTLQAWRMFKVKHKLVSQHIPNPCHKSITRWVKNFKETGSVNGGVAGHKSFEQTAFLALLGVTKPQA